MRIMDSVQALPHFLWNRCILKMTNLIQSVCQAGWWKSLLGRLRSAPHNLREDHVQVISLNILTLTKSGQPAIAAALENLTDAICVSQEIPFNQQEISFSQQAKFLDQLEKLSKQATLVREKQAETQIIKSILMNLATDLDASDRLSAVWSAWIYVIYGFFGCQVDSIPSV